MVDDREGLRASACRAYVWGYPLVRAAQLRANITRPRDRADPSAASVASAPLNALGHARMLATPATRVGVAPNNDTLYTLAWLDLSAGSFTLETPDFGDRYYTFQMGQADSSTERSFGQRTHGSRLPPLFISGPGGTAQAPADMEHVRSRYRYLLVAGRILVDGAPDLPAVHRLQDQVCLRPRGVRTASLPAPDRRPGAPVDEPDAEADPALAFLVELGAVLAGTGVAPEDRPVLASLAPVGLTPLRGYRSDHLDADQKSAIAAGLRDGEALVRAKTHELGHKVNGWSINYRGSNFGEDHLLRAAVALDQIYIVEAEEALYPNAREDSNGDVLDGRHCYRIRFASGALPPVGAFWSITLYYAKGFMVPNPIDRWSIGDRTPGLVFDDDGALEILVQHAAPQQGRGNWLPAPAEPFMLLMRLYCPLPRASSGQWVPPPVERLTS